MRVFIELISLAILTVACIYVEHVLWKKGEHYYHQEYLAHAWLWALLSWICGASGMCCMFFLCVKILEVAGVR